jgi:formamidopyrimidine-DNA glycosylase
MPEVAEVELVRRGLARTVGLTLRDVIVTDPRLTVPDLRQPTVTAVRRHGKLLGFELTGDTALTCHLRMTGALTVAAGSDAARAARERPHVRAVLVFGDDLAVCFSDVRRFGTLTVEPASEFAAGLGADLLDADDRQLAAAAERCAALRLRRPVKAVMLDQRGPVAGAGNYLCDESLFAARVHPAQRAGTLAAARWLDVWQQCQAVARRMLAAGGVSMRDYVRADGSRGEGQRHLCCYGRAGLPCPRCQTTLTKITVAGRGTTFCPHCQQHLPEAPPSASEQL